VKLFVQNELGICNSVRIAAEKTIFCTTTYSQYNVQGRKRHSGLPMDEKQYGGI
jgi:hypothetical protein